MARKTEIVPWAKEWNMLYKQEKKRIEEVFKDEIIGIFHIGSTSIPSIGYAKPIIDILVIVKDIERVDIYNEEMRNLGYDPRGENGISKRRYFPKGKENRTHHVHIFQKGNENIKTHLAFKGYMMRHPADAKKYGELKLRLAEQFPDDIHKYQENKEILMKELVTKAKRWAEKSNVFQIY